MRNLFIGMLATSLSLAAANRSAHAHCDQTMTTRAEMDLWNVHGCDDDFMSATNKAAALRKSDWVERGWGDAKCNPNFEYPKFWNAWYLVTYGVEAVPPPLSCPPNQVCIDIRERPWHDDVDYSSLTRASGGILNFFRWHGDLCYQASDDPSANYGRYVSYHVSGSGIPILGGFINSGAGLFADLTPKIQQGCNAYDMTPHGDPPAMGATPTYRGSNFIHESWHAWNQVHHKLVEAEDAKGHEEKGPKGKCGQIGCDHFRAHAHTSYQAGELYLSGSVGRSAIPVYQIQLEYLCDVSDNAEPWIPYSVRESAANEAGWLTKNRFVESVPYWCGSTRPLWGGRPGGSGAPRFCTDQNRRSCDAGCDSGSCGTDGCCIPHCSAGTQCPANYNCGGGISYCYLPTGCCTTWIP